MTYTTPSDFSNTPSEKAPSTVEKVKTLQKESTQRSKRIAKILRTAFTETAAEFKAGRTVISPLAKEVTAETVATVKEKSQQASKTVNQAWQQEADSQDLTDRLISFVRVMAVATKEKLFPQLKTQATKLDDMLSDRYGHQYNNFKQKFNGVRDRYATPEQTTTAPVADAPTVIEVESEIIR